MKRVESKSDYEEKGERGLAMAVKLPGNKLRMDFESGKTFHIEVSKETLPENFPWDKMSDNKKKHVSATMNEKGDKVLFINPASGTFKMKLQKFVAKEGQEPVAETKPGKKGKDYKQFAVLLEIVEGSWKGTVYWKPFYPNFAPDEDGNLAVSGQGSGSDALYDFLQATGVGNHLIKYSDNPLPEIQRIALQEGKVFEAVVVKGWVDTILTNLDDDEEEDEENLAEEEKEPETTHPALDDPE
jgi:hypothetical protein